MTAKQLAGVTVHELFDSHIYLISAKDDPLAQKDLITIVKTPSTAFLSHTGRIPERALAILSKRFRSSTKTL